MMLASTIIVVAAHMAVSRYTLGGDEPPAGLTLTTRVLTAAWIVAAIMKG